jgi:C1A family cysteine protease
LTKGPVVVGTNWYDRMFKPEKGFIRVGGQVAGGHAWLLLGADRSKKCPDGTMGACRMINSWGRGWGESGRAWISFNDLDKLIKADGEAATAKELLLAA